MTSEKVLHQKKGEKKEIWKKKYKQTSKYFSIKKKKVWDYHYLVA